MEYKTQVRIVLAIIICALLVCGVGFYVDDYYHAQEEAMEVMQSDENMEVVVEKNSITFIPDNPKTGFIFYPGGKVEFSAYNKLLHNLAKQDILCVVVKMPMNLAVFDIDAAKGIPSNYPEINHWYIGGHSLGGSMAASYVAGKTDVPYDGLVLLASYSTEDLSSSDLKVMSLFGSEDKVLNSEKYNEYHENLPASVVEIVIEGGNHAQFGNYGEQDKDGKATISNEEQIALTTNYLLGFMQ